MKSRITIDFRGVDVMPSGQQFEPVIRATVEDSEDTRDGLMKAFFAQLNFSSNWLRADFNSQTMFGKESTQVVITPIKPEDILDTINTMITRIPYEQAEEWLHKTLLDFQNKIVK